MRFRLSDSHLFVRTSDGRGFKLSLDAAEKLRAFLQGRLYKKRPARTPTVVEAKRDYPEASIVT